MAPQLSGNSLDYIDSYVDNPYMRGLLGMIRSGEGTADPDGYRRMFGGKQFEDLSRHPAQVQRGGQYASDASGAYQFLSSTWEPLAAKYGLQDFSPRNQDRGAVALIREKFPDLEGLTKQLQQNGLTPDIVDKLAPVWASLPTKAGKSYYGQPVKSLQELQGAFSRGVSGRAQAAGGIPTAPGGDDSWMDAFTSSILKPSPIQGVDPGVGLQASASTVIDPSDPLKTLANVSLRMAGADETRARFQGLQNSIAALTAATLPGMKPISAADLMLPEERQVMQRGGQGDSAVEALQAMLGGGGNPTADQPMASGGSAIPLPQGAKPITALTTVEGGRFGAARPGRTHLAWDFADEDGTGLMLKPDSGARWGQIRPSDYGDIAELHTPDGSFRIIHGKKDRERGIYLQGGWGPGGPNAYAPHHDIAAIDPETGKQTGAFFDRGVLGKYLYSVSAR